VATVTAVDTQLTPTARHTAGAIHTTVDTVGVTDGIMVDGLTMADGVTVDTNLLAVTVDGVGMQGMTVADMSSPIQDTAADIADDLNGHRISLA
jgi:hypothetical protein